MTEPDRRATSDRRQLNLGRFDPDTGRSLPERRSGEDRRRAQQPSSTKR
ncbi:MAG: hypothetical protein ABR925_05305 [Acidimicrobiales bacterium]|jgi:hypothetical protein